MLILSTILFSVFDYVGYNLIAVKYQKEPLYRWIQGTFQVLLSIAVIILSGWIDAILFNFLWLCWVCDWLYYITDYLTFHIFGKSFESDCLSHLDLDGNCSWAWWTIWGFLTGMSKEIKFKTLMYQAIIGVIITIIIKGVIK